MDVLVFYRVSQKKFARLVGCEITSVRPIFKTEVLIYQSKGDLHEKILFDKVARHLEPEIRKCLKGACLGTKIPNTILVHNLLTIEVKVLFLKLTILTSMPHKSWARMERGIFYSYTIPLQAFFYLLGLEDVGFYQTKFSCLS